MARATEHNQTGGNMDIDDLKEMLRNLEEQEHGTIFEAAHALGLSLIHI